MSKSILAIFVLLLVSCGTTKTISYKKARKLNSKEDYYTVLNKIKRIDLNQYFLNPNNISEIIAQRTLRQIDIIQKNKDSKVFCLTEIESDAFKKIYNTLNYKNIDLVVIDGIIVNNDERQNYFVEYSSVKHINALIDVDSQPFIGNGDGRICILIITTY